MLRSRYLVSLLLSVSIASSVSADRIDDFVRAEMKQANIPGLSLAIVKGGRVVRTEGYGLASLELQAKVTTATVFEIGSVTKQFTAMLTLMLMEEGKLALDEPVRTYLPGLPEAWKAVTVRHLLTHTSGIKSYTSVLSLLAGSKRNLQLDDVLGLIKDKPMDFEPGSAFLYNNSGYYLLGALIEKLTGQTYWQALDERIFKPLDMAATRNTDPNVIIPNRARGYLSGVGRQVNFEPIQPGAGWAAGSMASTVGDMAKWDIALRSKRFLKPETYAMMWTPYQTTDGTSTGYGFGWMIEAVNGHAVVHHGGNTVSQSAMFERYLDDDLSVIVLANVSVAPVAKISRGIAKMLVPSLVEKAIKDENPGETKELMAFWDRMMQGGATEADFGPELNEFKVVEKIAQQLPMLKALGKIVKVELLERKEAAGSKAYRYRMTFEKAEMVWHVARDAKGQITGTKLLGS